MSNLAIVQTTPPAPLAEEEVRVWGMVRDAFLESKRGKTGSSATYNSYKAVLCGFFGSTFTKSPADYTSQEAADFVSGPSRGRVRPGAPVGANTMKHRIAILSSYYDFAQHWTIPGPDGRPRRLLSVDFCPPTMNLTYPRPPVVHRAISQEDLAALFAAIDTSTVTGKRDYSWLTFLLFTGRRREEAARLTWGDLRQTVFKDEKTGQPRAAWTYRYTRKGASQEWRERECPGIVISALMDYLAFSGRRPHMTDTSPLWACIAPPTGGKAKNRVIQLRGESMLKLLKKLAIKAGVPPEKVCVHGFRHSAAIARYAATQRDIVSVSRWLDHKNLSTTQVYLDELTVPYDKDQDAMRKQFPFLAGQKSEVQHAR